MDILSTFAPLLASDWLGHPAWMWGLFAAVIAALLALDLGLLHRGDEEIGVRQSLRLSAGYIGVACAFGAWAWQALGADSGQAWFTGYLIEKSLSIDNVFVIALCFSHLAIPRALQHRVLFWGILGALLLRGVLIGVGAVLVSEFSWLLYVFGAFLLVTGLRMLKAVDEEPDIAHSRLLAFLRRHLRITERLHGHAFALRLPTREGGRLQWWLTPLALALVLVEAADLLFALDSVPAIFAISTDPFIVYTSNIFALLGLRALYFALAALLHRFQDLKYALAAILVFIGGKIVLGPWLGHLPSSVSLGVTLALLAAGVGVSLWRSRASVGEGLAGGAGAEHLRQ